MTEDDPMEIDDELPNFTYVKVYRDGRRVGYNGGVEPEDLTDILPFTLRGRYIIQQQPTGSGS